jgi:alkylhydroperoxidase family enzyme
MRISEPVAGPTELDQSWGRRQQFYQVFMSDHRASIERVDPVLLELCRLRMASVMGSQFMLALRYQPATDAGLTEEKITQLPHYADSELYSTLERQCIEFAELFAIQSSAIGDGEVARLQDAMNTEPMIYFLKALSVMDQVQRSCVAFDLAPPTVTPPSMPGFVPVSLAA